MALVKFVTCSLATYSALTSKDAGTLYFVTDERRLYKGDTPYSGGIYKAVTDYPDTASAAVNTLYVNTSDGSVKYYNGSAYVTLVKPQPTAIGSGSADELATTKAVRDYVTGVVTDLDVSSLEERVQANEDAIGVINGGEAMDGSILNAIKQANDYTDELASGQVATNTTDIASLKSGKADKATTLAGYGITDAYTSTQTDSAIATAVANAGHLKRTIVDELPSTSAGDTNTIYMLKLTDGSGDQNYDEYMFINGAYEKVGDTKADLTDYAKTTYVDTQDAATLSSAKSYADSKVAALDKTDTAVANQYVSAVSETDGVISVTRATIPIRTVTTGTSNGTIAVNGTDVAVKGLGTAAYTASTAYATAAQGALADSALQAADIKTGTANGTISVDGTNVSVYGLGSAAYTASTAYDASGAADAALTSAKTYTDTALTWTEL